MAISSITVTHNSYPKQGYEVVIVYNTSLNITHLVVHLLQTVWAWSSRSEMT